MRAYARLGAARGEEVAAPRPRLVRRAGESRERAEGNGSHQHGGGGAIGAGGEGGRGDGVMNEDGNRLPDGGSGGNQAADEAACDRVDGPFIEWYVAEPWERLRALASVEVVRRFTWAPRGGLRSRFTGAPSRSSTRLSARRSASRLVSASAVSAAHTAAHGAASAAHLLGTAAHLIDGMSRSCMGHVPPRERRQSGETSSAPSSSAPSSARFLSLSARLSAVAKPPRRLAATSRVHAKAGGGATRGLYRPNAIPEEEIGVVSPQGTSPATSKEEDSPSTLKEEWGGCEETQGSGAAHEALAATAVNPSGGIINWAGWATWQPFKREQQGSMLEPSRELCAGRGWMRKSFKHTQAPTRARRRTRDL